MTTIKEPLTMRSNLTRGQKGYNHPRAKKALAEGDIQGVVDGLSVQQRRFCEEYVVDYNASRAVKAAEYNSKYPNKHGYQLLRNPAIKACIDQLTLERASESVLKPQFVIDKIVKTINKAEKDNNHNATLRGCELLARTMGMFIDRQEISGPNGDAIELKQVKDAADAFTRAVAGYTEREREGNVLKFPVG